MSSLIYKKMTQVMSEIGPVSKDQKNVQQGFKFRGIDQFVNALHPALVKNGVFMTPRVVSAKEEIKEVVRSSGKQGLDKHVSLQMEYDFFAEDGSKVTVGPIPAEGLDSGDKATNKALSAALKYALIQTFSIPTEDMAEADLESPEIGSSSKTDVKKDSNWQTKASKQEPTKIEVKSEVKVETKAVEVATPVKAAPSGFASSKSKGGFQTKGKLNGTAAN